MVLCVWSYLQDEQGQEVQVGRPLELLIQVQWEKGDGVVLVRLDGISLKGRGKQKHNERT